MMDSLDMEDKFLNSVLKSKLADWLFQRYKVVIAILGVAILLEGVFLVLSFFLVEVDITKKIEKLSRTKVLSLKEIKLPQLNKESYYTAAVSGKNIFKGTVKKEIKPDKEVSYDFVQNLKLKGIIGGSPPKAVIEDTRNRKTYLVKEGETFQGVKVEKIGSGTVTLSYKRKKFTLQL